MENVALNNNLTVTVPDGFHIMDAAEKKKLRFLGNAPTLCISDPVRHIIVSLSWKKNFLASVMLNPGEIVKQMESKLQQPMSEYGYKLREFFQEDLGGLPAAGFLYSYTAQDVGMTGESLCAKKGTAFYYIHCYLRQESEAESLSALKDFFKSFRWS